MVEVVHDFLTYVQAGPDVTRDAKRDISMNEVCLLSEDAADPARGRQTKKKKDLLFNEVLDVDFEAKAYKLQVAEFSLRCSRILPEIDQQLTDIQKMIERQPHCESSVFTQLLRVATDHLNEALTLIQDELRKAWFTHSNAFFYPTEGFLDLRDSFLTGKLLTREAQSYVTIFAHLQNILQTAEETEGLEIDSQMVQAHAPRSLRRVESVPHHQRRSFHGGKAHSVVDEEEIARILRPRYIVRDKIIAYAATDPRLPDLSNDEAAEAEAIRRISRGEREEQEQSRLGRAMEILDKVLLKDVNEVTSDMNRTMYLIFNRMCFCYVRWRRHFMNKAQPAVENPALANIASLKSMAAMIKKKASIKVGDLKSKDEEKRKKTHSLLHAREMTGDRRKANRGDTRVKTMS